MLLRVISVERVSCSQVTTHSLAKHQPPPPPAAGARLPGPHPGLVVRLDGRADRVRLGPVRVLGRPPALERAVPVAQRDEHLTRGRRRKKRAAPELELVLSGQERPVGVPPPRAE